MPLPVERASSFDDDERMASSATEYRECFLSPRREDYHAAHALLPKISSTQPPSNRSLISFDADGKNPLRSSEYRLCFSNHHPSRPYVRHAQPSHVFDYVPKPLDKKPTLYETYPSSRSNEDLLSARHSVKFSAPSLAQQKREQMTRSQHFDQLICDDDQRHGGRPHVGISEQRTAFQWPYEMRSSPVKHEQPVRVYPAYGTKRDIYEPLPPVRGSMLDILH